MATLTEKRDSEERQRLLKLVEDYKSKGYEVTLKPSPEDLPDFLSAYRPDMVVHRGSERAVVEVESRFSLAASSSYLRSLAEVIEQHSDWRLDLAMANSEETAYLYKAEESLQAQEVASGLQMVRQIATQNVESAILYAWVISGSNSKTSCRERSIKAGKNKFSLCNGPASYRRYYFQLGVSIADTYFVLA